MHNEFERPHHKVDLEDREAKGFWKAIALSKDIGTSDREINLNVVLELNKCILEYASPEAAGKLRIAGQDIMKLKCVEPPLGSRVMEIAHEFGKNMSHRVSLIPIHTHPHSKTARKKFIDDVLGLAAWVQHSIVAIHPFTEANGRTARLMTNVVLRRFNFPPTEVRFEAEDKDKYIDALCQVDKYGDYESLKKLILRGSLDTLQKEKKIRSRKQSKN